MSQHDTEIKRLKNLKKKEIEEKWVVKFAVCMLCVSSCRIQA
jgi:hypothetical protein